MRGNGTAPETAERVRGVSSSDSTVLSVRNLGKSFYSRDGLFGRREFKALEKAARNAGFSRARAREYVPYRILEVEVAANAVYWWAAEQILERRLPGERPADPAEYAAAMRLEAQMLRHRSHDKLMKAFLGPEVFEGTVVVAPPAAPASTQLRLA